MSRGSIVGIASTVAFALALPLVNQNNVVILVARIVLTWAGFIGWIVAGFLRPRWWFGPPVAILAVYVWILSLGH